MSFPQKVKSALWAVVDTRVCNTAQFVKNPGKDFTRDRKMGFVQRIRFFLCMGSGCISHELLKYFYFLPDEVPSASAFIQQRAELLPEAFHHILRQFNLCFPAKGLMGKYSLIAADGCEFNIARNPRNPSAFHSTSGRSKKGFSSLHIISPYDLLSKRYLDVVIQPGRLKNESAALCQLIDRYVYGGCPIFVADRGFASCNVFAHAIEKGCFSAIRAKDISTRRLLAAAIPPERMDRWVDVILTRSNARKKRRHPESGPLYRYICKAVPFDFITDSCPEYRMRLRVVSFQTANFHSKSLEYIGFEILCRMTLYNFCTIITMEIPIKKKTGKREYQVNLSMAVKIFFAFLSDHMGPEM